MFKDLYFYIKHPYTAGLIIVIWLGLLGFYWADQNLPIIGLVFLNIMVSLVLAFVGFRSAR